MNTQVLLELKIERACREAERVRKEGVHVRWGNKGERLEPGDFFVWPALVRRLPGATFCRTAHAAAVMEWRDSYAVGTDSGAWAVYWDDAAAEDAGDLTAPCERLASGDALSVALTETCARARSWRAVLAGAAPDATLRAEHWDVAIKFCAARAVAEPGAEAVSVALRGRSRGSRVLYGVGIAEERGLLAYARLAQDES
jgi:hypothetical protein